jgi:hypothetical protein
VQRRQEKLLEAMASGKMRQIEAAAEELEDLVFYLQDA